MQTNLAEALTFEDHAAVADPRSLYLRLGSDTATFQCEELDSVFIDAESVPELSVERQRAATEAARLMGRNRHLFYSGEVDKVPKPIDVLGTAQKIVEISRATGEDDPEYFDLRLGLYLDCERLIGEATTKNVSEYFAKKDQTLSPDSGEYYSHGLSISSMVKNGLSPSTEQEEQSRRINEYVEEIGTYVPLGMQISRKGLKGALREFNIATETLTPEISIEVTTISECTDYAIRDYAKDPNGAHGGYRPATEGIAIRRVHYVDDTGNRQEEQAIISGLYIDHEVIETVVKRKGGLDQEASTSKTELHGTQFISLNDGSLMEFVKELDEEASKIHGMNIFMGEQVPENHDKNYEKFMEDADERRKKLAPLPEQLTDLILDMAKEGIDSNTADTLIRDFLKEKLLDKAKASPELARAMFDEKTAKGFEQAALLRAQGKTAEAKRLEIGVRQAAPDPDYCGASSRSGNGSGSGEEDQFGPLNFLCPNGHLNIRIRGELIDNCQVCGTSVSC
ncbi:MAG TPA: hypothetical protein VL989_03505 [Candidatus Sulfotelmatobacter sp.]|nr:hypothetical protein [Candidatus Sulfotelmatobacter sp.]